MNQKLPAESFELWATIQTTSYELQATSYKLWDTSYELQAKICDMQNPARAGWW